MKALFNPSRLILGTVQFGLDYGIANQTGKPSYEQACRIIGNAFVNGINTFDTAPVYGNSETVLRKSLDELNIKNKTLIITKVPSLSKDLPSEEAYLRIKESAEESLQRLGIKSLNCLLFHDESNWIYLTELHKLKKEGVVDSIGVSVYSVQAAKRALESGMIDALELQLNLLDQRFIADGICAIAKANNVAVLVRSIYLQGVLRMQNALPDYLAEAEPLICKYRSIAEAANMPLAELASRFVLSVPEVSSVIFGVDSHEQLDENIALFNRGPLDSDIYKKSCEAWIRLPDEITLPSLWKKTRKLS